MSDKKYEGIPTYQNRLHSPDPSDQEYTCKHGGVSAKRTCYDGMNIVLSYSRYINEIRYITCWKCEWLCQGCNRKMGLAGWCSSCRISAVDS